MPIDLLTGMTVRDLVSLVQSGGHEAAAAHDQLLASHAALIRAAARAYPSAAQAENVARTAFEAAVCNFPASTSGSFASYCWTEMTSALKAADAAKKQPQQLPLVLERVPTSVNLADLQLLSRIATTGRACSLRLSA